MYDMDSFVLCKIFSILYIGITLRNINIIIIFKNIENYQIEYFQNLTLKI